MDGRLGAAVLGPRREELQGLLRMRIVEAVAAVGEAREECLGVERCEAAVVDIRLAKAPESRRAA